MFGLLACPTPEPAQPEPDQDQHSAADDHECEVEPGEREPSLHLGRGDALTLSGALTLSDRCQSALHAAFAVPLEHGALERAVEIRLAVPAVQPAVVREVAVDLTRRRRRNGGRS